MLLLSHILNSYSAAQKLWIMAACQLTGGKYGSKWSDRGRVRMMVII